MRIIRWIVMLPSAIVCGWLAYFVGGALNRIGYLRETGEVTPFMASILDISAYIAMGAATTYIAARIAPSHKNIVSVSITGLVLLLSGAFIFASVLAKDYFALIYSIALIVGSLWITLSVFRNEIEL